MKYSVRHKEEKRENFGPYRYDILQDTRVVATYSHDYRGDEHWLEFEDGTKVEWPVGKMTDFLRGGGSLALRLSDEAIAFLKDRLES